MGNSKGATGGRRLGDEGSGTVVKILSSCSLPCLVDGRAEVQKRIVALSVKQDTIALNALERDVQVFEASWKLSPGMRSGMSLKDLRLAVQEIRQKKRIDAPAEVLCAVVAAFVQDCVRREAYDLAAKALCPWHLPGEVV